MKKNLYLCRTAHAYEFATTKHGYTKRYGLGGAFVTMCSKNFESITGIHLKPGELRRIKSITIELEE